MGYNRSGDRHKQRLNRRRKEERRLIAKAVAAGQGKGLGERVKDLAHAVAEKASDLAHAVVDKVTGKGG